MLATLLPDLRLEMLFSALTPWLRPQKAGYD